ncbi:jerky protein homolog-like [Centruroides sculpturatus]|uniref:jerky protein homolog-like n=1 Tax=Centruroides sculpturatus TaxID=218467 RepID=UPI000C6D962F|nr:jerky protein homolog-like [Centruroides sculpturatus]
MTSNIFHDWFHNSFVLSVQKFLRGLSLDPRALLLLDNCPAHPTADNLVSDDGNIKVMCLPKNTTALIQPLDQGIISAFKTNYQREMMKSLLASDIDINIFFFKMDLKDVSYIDLDETTTHSDSASDIIFTEVEISHIWEILNEPEITNDSLTDWLDEEAREDICQNINDEMIIESICSDEDCQEETEDDEESASEIADIPPTTKEAITAMETVIKWAESKENINSVRLLILASFKREMIQKLSKSKQTKNYSLF